MGLMLGRFPSITLLTLTVLSMLLAPAKQTYVLVRQLVDKEFYEELSKQVIDKRIIRSLKGMHKQQIVDLQVCSRTYYSPSVFLLNQLRYSLPDSVRVYFPNDAICRLPVREGSKTARIYFGGGYRIELQIDARKAAGID